MGFICKILNVLPLFLDAEIKLEHKIVSITEHAGKWQVATESGTTDLFDCVVLTFPVPQILQLQGSIQSLLGEKKLFYSLHTTHFTSARCFANKT